MSKLKEYRKKAGLTQEALAKLVGVWSSTISQYESGTRSPNVSMLLKLSRALNCTIDELLAED